MIKKLIVILALVLSYNNIAIAQEAVVKSETETVVESPEANIEQIKKDYNDTIEHVATSYPKNEKLELVRAIKGLKLKKDNTRLVRRDVDVNDPESMKNFIKGNLGNQTIEKMIDTKKLSVQQEVKKEVQKEIKVVAPEVKAVKVEPEKKTFRRNFTR